MPNKRSDDKKKVKTERKELFGFCRDCIHWQPTAQIRERLAEYPREKHPDDGWLDAVCSRIEYGVVISASGGWSGASVDSVETNANFGCRFFEPSNTAGFVACADCDDEMCAAANECFGSINAALAAEEEAYIAKGVCSDCGACSLKDAAAKCRPRALGETGDVTCAGEKLWRA